MIPFLPEEIKALRDLANVWPDERMVLLGASALRCFLEMSWRTTEDLDLLVAASVADALAALALLERWVQDPHREHRWRSGSGIAVDIVAADEEAMTRGYIDWPRSGFRMTLLGMRLAFEHAVVLPIAADLDVRVAPLPALAVMKIVAYLADPGTREKDLGDLAAIMHGYADDDSERRFSSEVPSEVTEFDDVGPFLLGRDVASIVNPEERRRISDFLAAIENEDRGPQLLQRLAIRGPVSWRDPDTVLQRILAFRRGIDQ